MAVLYRKIARKEKVMCLFFLFFLRNLKKTWVGCSCNFGKNIVSSAALHNLSTLGVSLHSMSSLRQTLPFPKNGREGEH